MCFTVAVGSCLADLTSGSFSNDRITHFSRAQFCAVKLRNILTSSRNESSLQNDLEEGSNLVNILHMHIDSLLLHPLERCCESLGQGELLLLF